MHTRQDLAAYRAGYTPISLDNRLICIRMGCQKCLHHLGVFFWKDRTGGTDEFESAYWTKVAAGVPVEGTGKAFAPSLLTAFRSMSVGFATKLLPETEPLMALFNSKIDFGSRIDQFIDLLIQVAQDHQWADAQGWTEQRKREKTAYNIRRHLRIVAAAADKRLAQQDAAYSAKTCTSGQVQDLLVALYEREPQAMPLFRVDRKFIDGASALIKRGQVVNGKVSRKLRDKLKGSLCDWIHVMGAAYCDVFTCDGEVSNWLGDIRTTLGLRPQFSARRYPGGDKEFVRDLIATWP